MCGVCSEDLHKLNAGQHVSNLSANQGQQSYVTLCRHDGCAQLAEDQSLTASG